MTAGCPFRSACGKELRNGAVKKLLLFVELDGMRAGAPDNSTDIRAPAAGRRQPGSRDLAQVAREETSPRRSCPSGLRVASSVPPWAATIARQIDSPSPRPSRLVVKNGSKMTRQPSSDKPVPRSLTSMTPCPSRDDVRTRTRRSCGLAILNRVEGIHQEVEHDLLDLHAIAQHRRQIGREVDVERDAVRRRCPDELHDVATEPFTSTRLVARRALLEQGRACAAPRRRRDGCRSVPRSAFRAGRPVAAAAPSATATPPRRWP